MSRNDFPNLASNVHPAARLTNCGTGKLAALFAKMIRSFDIFDTCLTRRVAEPAGVFDCMAKRLGLESNFRFMRQEAEREATCRHKEATLFQIYEILGIWLNWSGEVRDQMISEELFEETRQLIPVPEILQRVKDCRSTGAKVVFLSDMYLPSSFLVERLEEHGFYQSGDLLLVSCETHKTKTNGELFKEAGKSLGEQNWEHTGNHLNADVRGARRAGLKGIYFPQGNLTSHESKLLAWTKEGEQIGASWAAAARQARIMQGPLSPNEHAIASVAAGVASPLLLAYVTWLCQRAVHHRLDRLYFLARDGQILRDLFIKLAKAKGLSIEARYLHASRIALRFPRQFPLSDEDAALVFQANDALPIKVIALRLGIEEQSLRSLLPTQCRDSHAISKEQVSACRQAFSTKEACELFNSTAAIRSNLLKTYLLQQGLMDNTNYGLVDLGWGGSLQAGIQKTLTAASHSTPLHGFYLGIYSLPTNSMKAEAFAFDLRITSNLNPEGFSFLSELFCQASHGSTLGFKADEEGFVTPVMDELDSDNPLVHNWFEIYSRTVRAFVDTAIATKAVPSAPESLTRLLREHFRGFYLSPPKEEAKIWGACRFSSHGDASIRTPLAPLPRSFKDFLWVLGIRRFGAGNAIWPHAALACWPTPLAQTIRLCQRLVSRIRRR